MLDTVALPCFNGIMDGERKAQKLPKIWNGFDPQLQVRVRSGRIAACSHHPKRLWVDGQLQDCCLAVRFAGFSPQIAREELAKDKKIREAQDLGTIPSVAVRP